MGKKIDAIWIAGSVILGLFLLRTAVSYFTGGVSTFGEFAYMGTVSTFTGGLYLILLAGHSIGLGKPLDRMPPENKPLQVDYIKFSGLEAHMLLSPLSTVVEEPKYYKIKANRLSKNVDRTGLVIKNVYGTIQVVSLNPS